MGKIRAIQVSAKDLRIQEHMIEAGNLKDIYRLGGFDCFAIACTLKNGDTLFVDDEGLLKEQLFGFKVDQDALQYAVQEGFIGNAVILGTGEDGDSISAASSLIEIAGIIEFLRAPEHVWPEPHQIKLVALPEGES